MRGFWIDSGRNRIGVRRHRSWNPIRKTCQAARQTQLSRTLLGCATQVPTSRIVVMLSNRLCGKDRNLHKRRLETAKSVISEDVPESCHAIHRSDFLSLLIGPAV